MQPLAAPPDPAPAQGGGVNENPGKTSSNLALTRWPPGGWGEDTLYVYHERLGIADDLGMDTVEGAPAERVALRETRRVVAGLPSTWPDSREPGVADAMLAAFEPSGGLRFAGFEEGTR